MPVLVGKRRATRRFSTEFPCGAGSADGISGFQRNLKFSRTLWRGVYDAGKSDQHAVAGRINEAPVMLRDQVINGFAMGRQRSERRLFVFPHEAAIAEYVGAEYGGGLAFDPSSRSTRNLLQARL